MNFFGILKRFSLKYLAAIATVLLFAEMVFGFAPHAGVKAPGQFAGNDGDTLLEERSNQRLTRRERRRQRRLATETGEDSLVIERLDSLLLPADSLLRDDSLRMRGDTTRRDTTRVLDAETLRNWLRLRTKVENVKIFVEP